MRVRERVRVQQELARPTYRKAAGSIDHLGGAIAEKALKLLGSHHCSRVEGDHSTEGLEQVARDLNGHVALLLTRILSTRAALPRLQSCLH